MFRFNISIVAYCFLFLKSSFLIQGQQKSLVFENVNVIPMDKDTILYNQRVIIIDGKISKIQSASIKPPKKVGVVIPSKGKYLIPGLSEMHYHMENNPENEFKMLIANGVTTVRDMAEYQGQDHINIRAQTNKNEILAPYYVTTGPYLKANDLKTTDEVINVVKKHHERGYDFLKIADNLPKEIYLKLLEETNKYNIPVVGHGQRQLPLEYSLRMKSIAHIEEFMNIFNAEQKADTIYLKKAAAQIKSSGIYVSPTLGIFGMISRYADDKKFEILKKKDEIKYLPERYSAYFMSDSIHYRTNTWFTAEESLIRLRKELEWQKEFTRILAEQKVPLLSGSDTYGLFLPGFSLHNELELINKSGISPYETLKTSTIYPARYLNTIAMRGTITEGKFADLVLLQKNPFSDIKNTKTIEGVVLKGMWLNRKTLNKMLKEVEISVKKQKMTVE
ncbi:amidohydrolase family protein [Aquimarina sp. 2201CG5-10]|uniref:amidohydrolase family protein n=1 Tax=Aquimarina callyspongiae TaxID=3098150 RepID=UPI002AB4E1C4|nr:amidohydrolase family protein [Aquimarina sp. 2201CG5-10]MDY8134213.1 amidohydrolase family protein [Aquimarina sp. 2201CG5-10]